jgi:DNA-binding NtrC family response regulator
MLEDTLFGHERGAFTGAQTSRRGVFEQANGGTLFLDEIGELPISQQASLLRVLDDKQVRRIGAEGVKRVDFRLVTATNRPLKSFTQTGEFRLDLYHRIATLEIETKPIRERPEDVEPLALHFLELMRDEIGQRALSSSALEKLMSYSWPGNARELKNALYRAAVRSREQELNALHFELSQEGQVRKRPNLLDQVSDSRIVTVLDKHRGNVAAAARDLGVPRTSLRDRAARI